MAECCYTCKNRYALERLDYSQGGCKHDKVINGFICMACGDEGIASFMVGLDMNEGACEAYVKADKPRTVWGE